VSNKLKKKREQKKKRQNLFRMLGAGLLLAVSAVFVFVNNAKHQSNPALVEVQGRPAVKVDQELIDYGYKKWNTNVAFDITVTNVGDKTLRFSETPYVETLEGC
jgi:hypothetical protein